MLGRAELLEEFDRTRIESCKRVADDALERVVELAENSSGLRFP
jgi:hypothetical protein